MENYNNFKHKLHVTSYNEHEHWITGENTQGQELRIAKIASFVRFPKAVATAIAESMNKNKDLKLVDLI